LIPDIEKFLPVAIFKMAVTIPHYFNIVRFQWTLSWRGVFNSTLCDKVCQLLNLPCINWHTMKTLATYCLLNWPPMTTIIDVVEHLLSTCDPHWYTMAGHVSILYIHSCTTMTTVLWHLSYIECSPRVR
jgi:hypothetical protein